MRPLSLLRLFSFARNCPFGASVLQCMEKAGVYMNPAAVEFLRHFSFARHCQIGACVLQLKEKLDVHMNPATFELVLIFLLCSPQFLRGFVSQGMKKLMFNEPCGHRAFSGLPPWLSQSLRACESQSLEKAGVHTNPSAIEIAMNSFFAHHSPLRACLPQRMVKSGAHMNPAAIERALAFFLCLSHSLRSLCVAAHGEDRCSHELCDLRACSGLPPLLVTFPLGLVCHSTWRRRLFS